jgi:NAD-dependent deacetylase sirtuin 2
MDEDRNDPGPSKSKEGLATKQEENESDATKEEEYDSDDAEKNSTHSSDEEERDPTSGFSMDQIRKWLQEKLHIGSCVESDSDQRHPHILNEFSLDGIVEYIMEGRAKNIITMAGAGISTSAGIPDFRSPSSGIYANLGKFDLPNPMAIFDIRYFQENPKPFFVLAKELYPKSFDPTPCHYLIKLLHDKGLLLRHYTQNIDMLERVAGLPPNKLIEAHGSFHTGTCLNCKKVYTRQWMKTEIFADRVPKCESCDGGVVKPDIIFFGEDLPARFFNHVREDFSKCDLLIIMGTSLQVQPFASLIDRVSENCPRVLINRDKAGGVVASLSSILSLGGGGLQYDKKGNYRDVFVQGYTDDVSMSMVEKLGWTEEHHTISQVKHDM